jgi:hypothetical protein
MSPTLLALAVSDHLLRVLLAAFLRLPPLEPDCEGVTLIEPLPLSQARSARLPP